MRKDATPDITGIPARFHNVAMARLALEQENYDLALELVADLRGRKEAGASREVVNPEIAGIEASARAGIARAARKSSDYAVLRRLRVCLERARLLRIGRAGHEGFTS